MFIISTPDGYVVYCHEGSVLYESLGDAQDSIKRLTGEQDAPVRMVYDHAAQLS